MRAGNYEPCLGGGQGPSSPASLTDLWLQVDVLVTTAGGVEEDFIKCLAPTYLGDFSLRGKELRENGINRWRPRGVLGKGAGLRVLGPDAHMPHICRIGNLLVPNDNYCKFEDWVMPILDQMVLEQNTEVGQE